MSVENDPGFWKWVAGAVVSLGGTLFGFFKWHQRQMDRKADKHTVNNQFQRVESELAVQRGHIGKVFDQMRENEQRAQDRQERLLERLSEIGK